jgi:hypothetical protein
MEINKENLDKLQGKRIEGLSIIKKELTFQLENEIFTVTSDKEFCDVELYAFNESHSSFRVVESLNEIIGDVIEFIDNVYYSDGKIYIVIYFSECRLKIQSEGIITTCLTPRSEYFENSISVYLDAVAE